MAMHNQQASGQQAAATAASATRDGHCLWPPPFAVVATQCSRARFKRRTACAACSFEAELIKEGAHVLIVMMLKAGVFDLKNSPPLPAMTIWPQQRILQLNHPLALMSTIAPLATSQNQWMPWCTTLTQKRRK